MTLTAIGTTVAAAGGRGATVGNGPGRRRNEGGSRQNRTGSDRNAVGSPQNERGSAQRGPGSDERTAGSDLNWGCEHPERPPPLFERLERADSTRLVADTCTPCCEQWIPLLRRLHPPLRTRAPPVANSGSPCYESGSPRCESARTRREPCTPCDRRVQPAPDGGPPLRVACTPPSAPRRRDRVACRPVTLPCPGRSGLGPFTVARRPHPHRCETGETHTWPR